MRPTVYERIKYASLLGVKSSKAPFDPFMVSGYQKSNRLDKHTGCINTITWNEDGSRLVSGSDDRHIVIWDFPSFRPLHAVHSGHRNNIFSATFLSGSRQVVTSAADGSINLVDVESGEVDVLFETDFSAYCFKHIPDPNSPQSGFATLSDGYLIRYDTRSGFSGEVAVCVRDDSTVRNLSSGRFTAPPSGTALALNPMDPNTLALGTNTRAILMYDVRSFRDPLIKIVPLFTPIPESYPGETESVSDIVWDKRNRFIVNYCRQNLIEVDYNYVTAVSHAAKFKVGSCPEIPRQWTGRINHQTFLKQVALLDDQYILTGGDCGHLYIWERFGSQRLILKKPADPYVLNCVAVHPSLPILATSGIASIADIWEPIAPFQDRITEHASEDSTMIPPASPPLLSDQERLRIAKILRAEGNEFFRSRNFEEALNKYTEMIQMLSMLFTDSLMSERNELLEKAWNNSAATLMEMHHYTHAIDACDAVLDINPVNVKALVRRAKCYNRLGDLEMFIEDMDRAVALDPNNTDLIRLMMAEDQEEIFPISYSACIVGHELVADHRGHDHVVYVIEVTRSDSTAKHRVYRRYSKFVLVDKLLESDYGIARTISRFPSFRRGTDEAVIDERKAILSELLDKLLAHFCPLVSEFLRIVPQEDSRYDFSAVTSEVTSGVQTPVLDDSDEEQIRKLSRAINLETPSFPIFLSIVNSISFSRNHSVAVELLRLMIPQVGKVDTSPTDAMNYLRYLSRLVSMEYNPSEAALVRFLMNHKISSTDWLKGDMKSHVTHNATVFGNRADVFRLMFALDKNEEELYEIFCHDEQAVSLYLMWRDRHVVFSETAPGDVGVVSSAGAISLMGPMSPLAASPARSRNQNSLAHDAREWLMVSLAALDDSSIFPSSVSSWTRVDIPAETASVLLGDIAMHYRPSASEFEVKFEWTFPAHVNMELLLGLLYNPDEMGFADIENYFGLSSACTVMSREEDGLVKKICAYFDDPKKAVANLLVTADRGVSNNTVVLAVVSDPSAHRPQTTPHRLIRSFHMGGCEVNVTSGQMKGLFNLSHESVFLIAGDLLGERLVLWKAIERFSHALKNSTIINTENPMSVWLRRQFSNS